MNQLFRIIALFFAGIFLANGPLDEPASSSYDDVETWEFLPFYGEMRFELQQADTGVPISAGTLAVKNLRLVESGTQTADENGRITIHQLIDNITYWGRGPSSPLFRFAAPGCTARELTVPDLAMLAGYEDPYSSEGIPEVAWTNEAGTSLILPLREFVITLSCG